LSLNDEEIALLLLLGFVGALYYWSTTQQGQDFIGDTVDNVTADTSGIPRGIRNNNPGNIVRNSIQWQGELTQAQVAAAGLQWDPKFVQFDGPINGLRALARILINYATQGDDTVDSIIGTYAPSNENDTTSYEQYVSKFIGIAPGQPFNVSSQLGNLMAAIVTEENGQQPYGQDQIVQAIAAASQQS
jgi:hypothetical protein